MTDVLERMRGDWDRRAREDHKLHIATGHASSEEAFLASGRQDLEDVILDGIWLGRDASVLEIGCGVGRLLVPLAERVGRAYGVDIAPTMVEKARTYAEGAPNASFAVTDGLLDGAPDGSLDFVYSFIVFQHIPDKAPIATYVREASRALRPGGVFRFQVDGRWRQRARRRPDTYDGVVFEPAEIRALARDAGFEVVEEWGAETHYHRLTCVKLGTNPRVRVFPSAWDRRFLEHLSPSSSVEEMVSGAVTPRAALSTFEESRADLSNRDFVREVYRVLLRRHPDAAGWAFHTGVLDGGFEDRAALVETFLMWGEFRDLARPPLAPAWAVLEALARTDGASRRGETVTEIADRLDDQLRSVEGSRFREAAFDTVCARPPDANDTFEYGPVLETEPKAARRALLLRLLVRTKLPPAAPPADRLRSLFARCDLEPALEAARGESFAGEGAVAHRILGTGWEQEPRGFVEHAYETILGRRADPDGAGYWTDRLLRGEMSRPELVREVLWCEELRGA